MKVNSIAPPHPLTIIGLTLYGSAWFLKCAETLVLIFFAKEKKEKKTPSKVGYLSKMAEMCALEICSTIHRGPICPEKKVQDSFECLLFISLEIYNFGWLLVIGGLFFCCSSPESGRGKAKDQNGGRGIGRYVHLHHAHSHDLTFGPQCSTAKRIHSFVQIFLCKVHSLLKQCCARSFS